MLLLAVLAVSELVGLVNGLIASAVGAEILVLLYFPPLGSLMRKASGDRLALTLCILIAALGIRMVGGRERSSSWSSDIRYRSRCPAAIGCFPPEIIIARSMECFSS